MIQILVQEAVEASHAADKLKKDIVMATGMLVSHTDMPDWDFLKDGRDNDETLDLPIPNMDAEWQIVPVYEPRKPAKDCYRLIIAFYYKGEEAFRRCGNGETQVDMDMITEIHSSLQYLYDGMAAAIPRLPKRMEYLKRVAEYTKSLNEVAQQ